MFYLVVCLNREFCGWSSEIGKEEYDSFNFLCPECFGTAITYSSKSNIETEDEIIGFLLPLIVGEAGNSKESME
jgi:hypothetical protein